MIIDRFLNSTQSMTGRLSLFFSLVSVVIGGFCFFLISGSLLWSEDRVAERRIMLDMNEAVKKFQSGEAQGKIHLDILTTAYNDINLVPEIYRPYLEGKKYFLGELHVEGKAKKIGNVFDSPMAYMNTYTDKGVEYPIILISLVDEIETTAEEFIIVTALTLSVVAVLIFIFGHLLSRLSKSLIEPINSLKQQLDLHQGDPTRHFSVPEGSAREFQTLANQLNEYRDQVNNTIKREQAFARYTSHELRTPLTVMKGSSSLLKRNAETDFQYRQIDRIQDATQQMSTMVDTLLSLVRYERNQNDAPQRKLSEQEIRDIIAQNQAQADEKQLTFSLDVQGSPETKATSAVMSMILGNLLRNGIAATAKGTISITMDKAYLSVRDQGDGLSPIPQANGHGLGLMIVEDLCRRYDWMFQLTEHPSGGCEARIEFMSDKVEIAD